MRVTEGEMSVQGPVHVVGPGEEFRGQVLGSASGSARPLRIHCSPQLKML